MSGSSFDCVFQITDCLVIPQCGEDDDSTVCQDIAMLGPLMMKQYGKLKVGTCTLELSNTQVRTSYFEGIESN